VGSQKPTYQQTVGSYERLKRERIHVAQGIAKSCGAPVPEEWEKRGGNKASSGEGRREKDEEE